MASSNTSTPVVNQKDGGDTTSGPNHAAPTAPPTLSPEPWRATSPSYRPPSSPGTPPTGNRRKFWRVTPRRKTPCCCRVPCAGPVCLCYQRQILMGEDFGSCCPEPLEPKVFVSDSNPSSSACPSPGEAAPFDPTVRPPLIRQNGVDDSERRRIPTLLSGTSAASPCGPPPAPTTPSGFPTTIASDQGSNKIPKGPWLRAEPNTGLDLTIKKRRSGQTMGYEFKVTKKDQELASGGRSSTPTNPTDQE